VVDTGSVSYSVVSYWSDDTGSVSRILHCGSGGYRKRRWVGWLPLMLGENTLGAIFLNNVNLLVIGVMC